MKIFCPARVDRRKIPFHRQQLLPVVDVQLAFAVVVEHPLGNGDDNRQGAGDQRQEIPFWLYSRNPASPLLDGENAGKADEGHGHDPRDDKGKRRPGDPRGRLDLGGFSRMAASMSMASHQPMPEPSPNNRD